MLLHTKNYSFNKLKIQYGDIVDFVKPFNIAILVIEVDFEGSLMLKVDETAKVYNIE